jgi:hypothetical protein
MRHYVIITRKKVNLTALQKINFNFSFIIDESNVTNVTNGTDCRKPTIDSFPPDFLTLKEKQDGGLYIYI